MLLDYAQELKENGLSSATKFIDNYLEREDLIVNDILNFNGIKSEYYCNEIDEIVGMGKFLSIYSDLTSVFCLNSQKSEYNIKFAPKEIQVTIPPTLTGEILSTDKTLLPGYLFKNDSYTRKIFSDLTPLIDSGQFVIRPSRVLLVKQPEHPSFPQGFGKVYYSSSDSPSNHWTVKEGNEKNGFTIDNGFQKYQAKNFFSVSLPYFDKIKLKDLGKIISDEYDLINGFRVLLKELTSNLPFSSEEELKTIKRDKIESEIKKINSFSFYCSFVGTLRLAN